MRQIDRHWLDELRLAVVVDRRALDGRKIGGLTCLVCDADAFQGQVLVHTPGCPARPPERAEFET